MSSWIEQSCLPNDGSRPHQGHLLGDPYYDAALRELLTLGPAVSFLCAAALRIFQLRKSEVVVLPGHKIYLKASIAAIICALQLSLLAHDYTEHSNDYSLLVGLIFLLSDLTAGVISLFEDDRNIVPSALLVTYHGLKVFTDVVQVGLRYVAWNSCDVSYPLAVIFVARLALLVLESQNKRHRLRQPFDKLSPEETAGFYGVLSFWWVNDVLESGYSKIFSIADMPPLDQGLDAMKVRSAMQRTWDTQKERKGRYSLILALLHCSWRPNLLIAVPRVALVILRCSQPLLISRTIKYFNSDLTPFEDRNEVLRLVLLTFLVYTSIALLNGVCGRLIARIKTHARIALVGVIYDSCLKAKEGQSDDSAAMTLMSSDAEDAAECGELFYRTWSQMLELCVGMYMLSRELGWVCIFAPLLVYGISRIVEIITDNLGERSMAFRAATQNRISTIQAVLDSMKNIKMMGLAENMGAKIQASRLHESKQFVGFYQLAVAFFISGVALNLFSPAITLIVFAIQAKLRGSASLDMNMIFTSLAMVDIVSDPANGLLGVFTEAAPFLAAFDRIQEFLLIPERRDQRVFLEGTTTVGRSGDNTESIPAGNLDQVAVTLDQITVCPAAEASPVLKNVSSVWKKGDLVIISGIVGSGKTTLIRAILGDLSQTSGTIQTAFKSVAYCSQTAWLINGTVKDVICGFPSTKRSVNQGWYKRVIHACDLEEDLVQMPNGDQTIIGSRGTTLSGGQKQRVALARAVFARKGLVILDDVLSALDASTERHIVHSLLGPKGLFKELGTTVVLITHAAQHLPLADHIVILDQQGGIAEQGTWQKLRSGHGFISKLNGSEDGQAVAQKKERMEIDAQAQSPLKPSEISKVQDTIQDAEDVTLYKYYLDAVGISRLSLLMGSLATNAVLGGCIPYWLKWMAESAGQDMWYYASVYLILSVGAFISSVTAVSTTFLIIAPHAGNILHGRLLSTVMHAPQSYFATTETGTILNRFSTDIASIDKSLSFALFSVLQAIFLLISQCVLLGMVQPLVMITLPFTIFVVYLIQKVYLATSRQLSSIDLEAKALVNSSFLETLEGVSTIRAFGWQQAFIEDNAKKLDLSLRPEYLLMSIQRWLDLVLDLIVPGLAITILGFAIFLKDTTTGGQIGIALNVVLAANRYILRLVTAGTKLETSLGAVSHVRAFERDVLPEDHNETKQQPPKSWLSEGRVEIKNLSASYKPDVFALKDISLTIAPGTKVGIVGRTGSGKSSLLLSLLRLVDLGEGSIHIDGLDITTLPRTIVRSRIITIPQDPMLIKTDTIRQNLDVAGTNISNEAMVQALRRVGLWEVLLARKIELNDPESDDESTSEKVPLLNQSEATLSTTMKLLPLSLGQQQLFSLARALLMRSSRGKIVLLDEATSSVDSETDRVMQQILREEFKEYTVLTVAHRLESILDSDVVVVMSGGKIVEVGRPSELMERKGVFRGMVEGRGVE